MSSQASPDAIARSLAPDLLGRSHELAALDALRRDARDGHGGSLLLHGEPGVGKTALLEHAMGWSSEFHVFRTAGVEGEMGLPYAALHQLCSPSGHLIDQLPDPQRNALGVAFGLSTGQAPDPFLVGLAVLGLLSEAAEDRPLLCLVDDAQWLDDASARALVFVARRLLADRIAIIFAARQVDDLISDLPRLEVRGLGQRDSRALLESVLPARLDEAVFERIIAETHGNPLALLELPRGLTPAQLAGGFGLPNALPLSERIEESFKRRVARLPRGARLLLLIAAADAAGDSALVWRAAESLGIREDAARQIESEGFVSFGTNIVFRHPLVRSAIYRTSEPDERAVVHRALADATDPLIDPDRRAWHRAQAARQPDEEIASDLEESAARAQSRGGFAAAAAFLELATALTPSDSRRAGRALAAAQGKLQAGSLDDALRLLATGESGVLGELERAKATLLRGQISFLMTRSSDAVTTFLQAADQLRDIDRSLARETYLEALTAAIFAGPLAGPGTSSREVAEASRAAPAARVAQTADLLLDGFAAHLSNDYALAAPILRQAQQDIGGISKTEQLRWMWAATVSTLLLWDDAGWERLADRHLELVRETGSISELAIALSHRGQLHVFAAELASAETVQAALEDTTELTGSPLAPYHSAALKAVRGSEKEATQFIAAARNDVIARGEGAGISFIDWAESLLYNGLGRYSDALEAAKRVIDHAELVAVNWALPELIESAVRVGDLDLAMKANRLLTDMTAASGTDWALGVAARSRALLADDDHAEDLYCEAIERLKRTRLTVELSRAHLVYGEWLRRQNRRLDARAELRIAHEMFTAAGIGAFAERARVELVASGEHARKRTRETVDQLTPQEGQVARLAAQGKSNKEIAAQLFISASTVEYHLGKAFRKLDVKSRTQLAQREL